MNCPEYVKRMAREDVEDLLEYVNQNEGLNAELVYLDFTAELTEQDPYEKAISCWCDATINFGSGPRYQIVFPMEYFVGDDDVYSAGDMRDWQQSLEWRMRELVDAIRVDDAVESAQKVEGSTVTAAAEDEDMEFSEEDEGLDDTLDDIADNIEDMQESIDEVQEDDVNIDMDNNIDQHYIAECDVCHGIFISAVSKSDEEISKITGVCPLCNKETDQYLRWVVQKVE